MVNAFNEFLRGQQAAMQQGQNALALRQFAEQRQRDRQLRDIMARSAMPAMPSAPAMGPTRPGETLPDYPEQGGDMVNALYRGGMGPEAMDLQIAQMRQAGTTPSDVKEYLFFMKNVAPKGTAAIKQYMDLKRAQQIKKIGGVETIIPTSGELQPLGTIEREASAAAKLAGAKKEGAALGEEKALLADMEANLPNLNKVVSDLSKLGKIATYTKAGRMRDEMMREAGLKPTKGAVARREYIAKVDNEILPLLKQTFGAAFTVEEGARLKATLGDENASPEEKDAVLKAFIEGKVSQIATKKRRVGNQAVGKSGQTNKVGDIVNGPDGRRYIIRSLKSDGTPDDVELAQ